MKVQPKPKKGERLLDCPHYESCLDFAAIQNWRAFNCESCGYYIETLQKPPAATVKQETTRICEKCGKKPTIQASSPLCASCIGKQAWKDGKAKKKIPSKPKRKETQGTHKSESGQSQANFEVVFSGKYSQVLKEVEKLAEEEIRSIDEQIVFILKNYLKGVKESQKT